MQNLFSIKFFSTPIIYQIMNLLKFRTITTRVFFYGQDPGYVRLPFDQKKYLKLIYKIKYLFLNSFWIVFFSTTIFPHKLAPPISTSIFFQIFVWLP